MKLWIPTCPEGFDLSSQRVVSGFVAGFAANGCDVVHSPEAPTDIAERVQFEWTPYFTYFRPDARAARRVLFTLFDWAVLPPTHAAEIKGTMNQAEIVFVSGAEQAAICETYGVRGAHVSPLGIDPTEFRFIARDFESTPFTFAHIGSVQIRKGSGLLFAAFREAFPTESDVRLLVHGAIYDHLEWWSNRLADDERFVFSTERLTTPDLVEQVYAKAHVLVAPSFMEGYGLTVWEALATGMPAIASSQGAFATWFRDDWGWGVSVGMQEFPISQLWAGVFGHWRMPSFSSLVGALRAAYENREECRQRGEAGAWHVRTNLTWQTVAANVLAVIGG